MTCDVAMTISSGRRMCQPRRYATKAKKHSGASTAASIHVSIYPRGHARAVLTVLTVLTG